MAERDRTYEVASGVVPAASLLPSVAQPLLGLLTDRGGHSTRGRFSLGDNIGFALAGTVLCVPALRMLARPRTGTARTQVPPGTDDVAPFRAPGDEAYAALMADAKTTTTDCDRLVELVVPPAAPVDAHGDWTAAETAIGTRLPGDYKRLVETYGWGEFCDFLSLRTPFGTSEHNGLAWRSAHLTGSPERDPGRSPRPPHPAPGGLLVWGTTANADRPCWLTGGSPDDWPVVVWGNEGRYETHPLSTAAFIEGWAAGRVGSRLLTDMEPGLVPWFNAFRPRLHRCLHLSASPTAHPERLRRLREALAPTTDRGSWRSTSDETGQDHFATVDTDWLLTYDASRPHQIRIDFPPEDSEQVRQRLLTAAQLMGCEVLRITTASGRPLSTWDTATDEDE
ncbi:SMI1/KNR4 family protein [Streptomyces sp. NPDC088090]|uniref:SMI1/KNR4 family protein n=1 Tax=Streptomyces sp. NPDC088090 TaxID=3365822 RepID=UPI00384BBD0B